MTLGCARTALSRTASAFTKRNISTRHQRGPRFYSAAAHQTLEEMEKIDTTSRLQRLRELMRRHEPQIDVYIVPTEDAHASEYIAPCDARRAYICGFNGSAGTAVITDSTAAISTDGRYFNQAEKQIDGNWQLLKQGLPDVPTWQEWTCESAKDGKRVGVDPTLLTAQNAKALNDRIKRKGGLGLFPINTNLVDEVWGSERPPRPSNAVTVLDEKFAGKPISEKIESLRAVLAKKNSSGFLISMLDEIMWLYNVRGSDIPYNPVFFSYALVTPDEAILYVDSQKLEPDVLRVLEKEIKIKPYEAIFQDATSLAATKAERKTGKFLVSNKASWALVQALGGEESVEIVRSPVEDAKAIKNEVELEGMRQCHIRDGAALTEFFAWLEEQLKAGVVLDEVQAADKLEEIRSKGENFVGLSFSTISSTGPNAAVIHYHPQKGSCSVVDPNEVYLCDSGAQYYDGTTDTTRTLHFGEPTEMEKKAYTLVLKGHISLSKAVFPKGTNGYALDTLARQYLWNEGLDYRHGTGHGVGSYLNVHEGPIGIGTRVQYSEVPLSVGNVISNEPGYYEDGAFGIRIENVVMVKEVKTNHKFGDKTYLGFEHVTMVPMCKKLTDVSLLTDSEKEWLNAYHAEVYEKTKGFFQEGSSALKWLTRETSPV